MFFLRTKNKIGGYRRNFCAVAQSLSCVVASGFKFLCFKKTEYSKWIKKHESDLSSLTKKAPKWIEEIEHRPLFSIIMLVHNANEELLTKSIDSINKQLYTNWELYACINGKISQKGRSLLDSWSNKDERIRFIQNPDQAEIFSNLNSVLELVSGDYTVLLDSTDELRPHSLLEVAKCLNKNPGVLFLYSDEDKIDVEGKRHEPYFKPDWDPDLFYSQNYINKLAVLETNRLRKIGGWDNAPKKAPNHGLYLRFLHKVPASQIIHIPKVLCHCHNNSLQPDLNAVSEYLKPNVNESIHLSKLKNAPYHKINFPLPKNPPMVSLIIPVKDKLKLTSNCIKSIFSKTSYENYEIIIVDNLSVQKETHDFLNKLEKEQHNVRVLKYNEPFNYSAITNFGIEHANGEIIGLINNDIEIITTDWLKEMVSHAIRPDIGCVGAKLYYPNNTIQHGGVLLGVAGTANHAFKHFPRRHKGYFNSLVIPHSISAVTAACLVVEKHIFNLVNGFDEKNLPVAFNDVDFCLKVMTSGYRNLFDPHVEAFHLESVSRGKNNRLSQRSRARREVKHMWKKWGQLLKNDPYYSQNLTKKAVDYNLI